MILIQVTSVISFFTNFISNFKLSLIIPLAHLNKKQNKKQSECKLILVKANYSLRAIF